MANCEYRQSRLDQNTALTEERLLSHGALPNQGGLVQEWVSKVATIRPPPGFGHYESFPTNEPAFSFQLFIGQPRQGGSVIMANMAHLNQWLSAMSEINNRDQIPVLPSPAIITGLSELGKVIMEEGLHNYSINFNPHFGKEPGTCCHVQKFWSSAKLPLNVSTCSCANLTSDRTRYPIIP
jgi:hypothetical protein